MPFCRALTSRSPRKQHPRPHARPLTPPAPAVPTHSISDALLFQIRERSRAEARAALAALAARLRARARRTPADDDLPSDTVLEQLRKLVPSEFLVAWAAWTTASDLIPPDRITDAVRWAVWAVYTIAAFFYVLWQLFEARHEEECRDFMIEEDAEVEAVVEDFRGSSVAWTPSGTLASPPRRIAPTAWAPTWTRSGVFESPPRPTHRPVESIAWTRSGVFESPPRPLLRPVESNGLHSTDSSAVSLFQFIYDEHWHRAPLLGVLGTERSDAGAEFRSAQSTHGVHSAASAALSAGASPSDAWLCMQAFVSAAAFMLLSAATGDVYLKPNFVLWAVLALVPLFPLFAQFVLPRRGRRRRRR